MLFLLVLLTGSGSMALAQQGPPRPLQLQPLLRAEMPLEVGRAAAATSDSILQIAPRDATSPDVQPPPPYDPCLPALYTNWQEFGDDTPDGRPRDQWSSVRIFIDRITFALVLEGIRADGSWEDIYRTTVALGDPDSPTPEGEFWINHVYSYPDVTFFHAASQQPIAGLYDGFLAPLLACDQRGHCQRHNDLGIHGFQPAASPLTASMKPDTYGAVSAGCIRLPDPCAFKSALIRTVGVGGVRKNERGAYHWLKKPVRVVIDDYYPGTEPPTLVSVFEKGIQQFQDGLKSFWGGFVQ